MVIRPPGDHQLPAAVTSRPQQTGQTRTQIRKPPRQTRQRSDRCDFVPQTIHRPRLHTAAVHKWLTSVPTLLTCANSVVMIDVDALLAARGGLLLASEHRHLKSSLSRWVRNGRLIRLMRGVYAHPAASFEHRVKAVQAMITDAVIAGEAALAIQLHRQPPAVIDVCTRTHHMPQPGYRFTRRTVPEDHAQNGLMSAVLAAVDHSNIDAGWIDELLRQRMATPATVAYAFRACPGRAGNRIRAQRVARTRTNPWSPAERRYHDLFDRAGLKGWVANYSVFVMGQTFILDAAITADQLAIEIDGRASHSSADAFERDRRRQNALVAAGWTVLRFTWEMLDDPDVIMNTINKTLKRLRRARHAN